MVDLIITALDKANDELQTVSNAASFFAANIKLSLLRLSRVSL